MRHPRLLTFAKVVAVRGSCELPRPRPPSTLDASNRLRYPRKYRKTAGQYPTRYLKFAPGAIGEPNKQGLVASASRRLAPIPATLSYQRAARSLASRP